MRRLFFILFILLMAIVCQAQHPNPKPSNPMSIGDGRLLIYKNGNVSIPAGDLILNKNIYCDSIFGVSNDTSIYSLNSDKLDGHHWSEISTLKTDSSKYSYNSDKLDGKHDTAFVSTTGGDIIYGDLTLTGELKYFFIHGVANINSTSYTPNVILNVPYRLTPGEVSVEMDGLTYAADSFKLIYAGDYLIKVFFDCQGGTNDDWELKLRMNNVPYASFWTGSTNGITNYMPVQYEWYCYNVTANSYVSFWLTNISNGNDPTIRRFKTMILKQPE